MSDGIPWERQPKAPGWRQMPVPDSVQGTRRSVWTDGKVSVISTVVVADLPGGNGAAGPQWHLSVSSFGKRPKPRDVKRALAVFGLTGAEEDNHHPGGARHFWLPVDPRFRGNCECKETEETITDPDGYAWQNPKNGEPCRGCELAALLPGRPCPLHSESDRWLERDGRP